MFDDAIDIINNALLIGNTKCCFYLKTVIGIILQYEECRVVNCEWHFCNLEKERSGSDGRVRRSC